MIEQVEEVRLKLECSCLCDFELLRDAQINVRIPRTHQTVTLGLAHCGTLAPQSVIDGERTTYVSRCCRCRGISSNPPELAGIEVSVRWAITSQHAGDRP